MNKPDLISTLKNLDALTSDQKSYLIDLVNTKKKYGLVWEDKPEDVEELLRQHLPVLTEVPERRILAVAQPGTPTAPAPALTPKNATQGTLAFTATNESTPAPLEKLPFSSKEKGPGVEVAARVEVPHHLLIEGDNLHALTALTFTHEGRVDVIYIDPPYNTGNKDFKYNDRFVDREDAYRHSKWLSFMHKRLLIAKRLLADTGVIFISIDDNEQAQLKMLCDEVFGEENFVADVIWQKNFSIKNDSKYLSQEHEFVLIYFKSIQYGNINLLERSEKLDARYKNPDDDPRGPWASSDLLRMEHRDNGTYAIKTPTGKEYVPKTGNSWRHPKDEMLKLIESNQIWFGSNNSSMPRRKRFLNEVKQGVVPQTIWKHEEVDHTQQAKQEVNAIIRELGFFFDTPKPVKLINRVLKLSTKNDKAYTILDFFAGSGTTLHATMQLNAEDGGSRQCILVTNNESNIAEEVCYERNKRVIEGYTNAKGQAVPGLTNNSLRYYRCEMVPSARTEQNRRELTRQSTELLKIKEGCYADITEASGFGPATCYVGTNERGKYTVVLYHNRRPQPLIAALCGFIKALPDRSEKVRLYAFSEEKDALLADFRDVADVVEGVPLPEAIYNAYRATFRTLGLDRKPPRVPETEADEAEADAEQPSLEFSSPNN